MMLRTLLIFCLIAVTQCSALTPKEVSKFKIPGQRSQDQCLQYAFCLNYLLFTKGVESRAVAYAWSKHSSHAVVLFQLAGQWYLIENEHDTAVSVSGRTDLERIQCFDARASSVRVGSELTGAEMTAYLFKLNLSQ